VNAAGDPRLGAGEHRLASLENRRKPMAQAVADRALWLCPKTGIFRGSRLQFHIVVIDRGWHILARPACMTVLATGRDRRAGQKSSLA